MACCRILSDLQLEKVQNAPLSPGTFCELTLRTAHLLPGHTQVLRTLVPTVMKTETAPNQTATLTRVLTVKSLLSGLADGWVRRSSENLLLVLPSHLLVPRRRGHAPCWAGQRSLPCAWDPGVGSETDSPSGDEEMLAAHRGGGNANSFLRT